MELMASQKLTSTSGSKSLFLRIEARGETYAFYYGARSAKWTLLKGGVDATFLSTRVAGGFVGSLYAMYATSLGAPSDNTAAFDWFEYAGNDELYKKR
jgi:alpha-N-arabinofuranosidase